MADTEKELDLIDRSTAAMDRSDIAEFEKTLQEMATLYFG